MTNFTIKNLKQIEDGAVGSGLSPKLEAHFARDELDCTRTGLSYQRLAPGEGMPFFHRHGKDEEVYVVLSGGGRMRLDEDEVDVEALDAIRVAPETVRAFAAGPDGIEYLAFGTHADGDAEMLPAEWGDG